MGKALTVLILFMWGNTVLAQAEITPEDFSAYNDIEKLSPTKTVYIHENNPKSLVAKLNSLHNEYAQLGWVLFQLNTYIKNEDVKGMFVTYRKVGITE